MKAKKRYNRGEVMKQIHKYAKRLRKNVPQSEQWFMSKYTQNRGDKFNTVLGQYIPDVHNKRYRYIIEIDGSIHDTTEVQELDAKKNRIWEMMVYKVFRIKAYDDASYDLAMKGLNEYLNTQEKFRKQSCLNRKQNA